MTIGRITLGAAGLLHLPVSVREAAGIAEGDDLVVIPDGPGRIVLATRAAIQDEVWAAAPARDDSDATDSDRVAETLLSAMRVDGP
jgi:bifunctional DNA-binding transcriptional regulator/antitoxin component of YhaV-PrlF toxin-antitoxin module